MGTMMVSAGLSAEGAGSVTTESATPQGRLSVPPAFMQTTGDTAVPLTSVNHQVALRFTPEIDFALDAISCYLTAIGTTGDVELGIHADGTSIEPNGDLNGSYINVAPTMTANNAPAPHVVGLWDSTGANAEVPGFEAYKAMDGSLAADNGVRSNATPTTLAPIYYTVDLGAGNAKIINRFRFHPFSNADANVRAFPRAWTFWGSNVASPTVNTDSDWTQLTGASAWTAVSDFAVTHGSNSSGDYAVMNSTAYRHYRWKITERNGTNAYVSIGEMRLLEAQSGSAPGTLLQSLGSKAIGSSVDAWIRHTFDPCQLQRGTTYWLVFTGADSKDFSLSVRRNNPTAGSMLPDGCATKQTTDGIVWTQSLQDGREAMLNVVLHSTAHHSPRLVYGRCNGRNVSLYTASGWSPVTIPAEGISLDCEALSVSTKYNVYLYDSSGTLALDATTTGRALQDGVDVKAGAASHRFVGVIGVATLSTGYRAPLDVPDARFVRNRYNAVVKELSKDPNYTGYTRGDHFGDRWSRLNNNDDFMMRIVSMGGEVLLFTFSCFTEGAGNLVIGFAVDEGRPSFQDSWTPYIGGAVGGVMTTAFSVNVQEGYHSIWPVVSLPSAQRIMVYLTSNTAPCRKSICLVGAIRC